MEDQHRTTPTEISPEAQYKEAYKTLRQHDRFIWQTPSIAVVVDGAFVVSTFALVPVWWVRELILGCAFVLTAVLTFALIKHRYFSGIEQGALIALEERYAEKHIQRTSKRDPKREYWGEGSKPNWFQKRSAYQVFIIGMCLISVLLSVLLYLNWAILMYYIPGR